MSEKTSLNYKKAYKVSEGFDFKTKKPAAIGGMYHSDAITEVLKQTETGNFIFKKAEYIENGQSFVNRYLVAINEEGEPMIGPSNKIALPCPPHCINGEYFT